MSITPDQDPIFTLTTGPVDAYPKVLQGLSRPVLYDYDPAFLAFYERTVEKLRTAFATQHVPVILQGEPVLALEAGAASLIARDDVVLNLVSGVYGAGFGFWAKRYCAELLEIRVPYDEVIDPEQCGRDAEIAPRHQSRFAVCHHDTPSGTINPVAADWPRWSKAHGGYLLVDAVSSFGGMEVGPDMVAMPIYSSRDPNKCLGCPPGTVAGRGDAARLGEDEEQSPTAPRDSILSILDWEHAWRRERAFPFTPSVSEIYGLDAALDLYLVRRCPSRSGNAPCTHCGRVPRRHAQAMGLSPLAGRREKTASPTTTAVRIPAWHRGRVRCAPRRVRATESCSPPAAARRSASWCVSGTWARRRDPCTPWSP